MEIISTTKYITTEYIIAGNDTFTHEEHVLMLIPHFLIHSVYDTTGNLSFPCEYNAWKPAAVSQLVNKYCPVSGIHSYNNCRRAQSIHGVNRDTMARIPGRASHRQQGKWSKAITRGEDINSSTLEHTSQRQVAATASGFSQQTWETVPKRIWVLHDKFMGSCCLVNFINI